MNLAEAYFVFAGRQSGRGFGGRASVLPVELKLGSFDLWPVFATAFAARTGVLDNLNGETVTPTDLSALVRTGFISTGSDSKDAEALLMKAIEVLRAVRAVTAEAYATARPPSPDLDAAGITAECDDGPKRPWGKKGKKRKDNDSDDDIASS
jgi:hypothetical protein